MARVPKVVSIERLVGGISVHVGKASGPEAEAVLAEIDRQIEAMDDDSLQKEETDVSSVLDRRHAPGEPYSGG